MPCRTVEKEIDELVQSVMEKYHKDLVEAGVTITTLWVSPKCDSDGNAIGPALKLHGSLAYAVVKINSTQDRVEGKSDATIKIDEWSWADLSDETRTALISHELTHLVIDRDKDGVIKLDDCNRPRLKMRPHDFECGIFFEVLDRHQKSSIEAKQYTDLHREMVQRNFDWS